MSVERTKEMGENFREFNAGTNYSSTKQGKKKKDSKGIGSMVGLVVGILAVLIILFNSVYSIKEQEQGVVTTFGQARDVVTSGLHFKIPLIQKRTNVDMSVRVMTIGYNAHTDDIIEKESLMLAKDFN